MSGYTASNLELKRQLAAISRRIRDLQVDLYHKSDLRKEALVSRLRHRAAVLGAKIAIRQITNVNVRAG